jgi:phosphatidate phosphatase APP1
MEKKFDRIKYQIGPRINHTREPIIVPYLGFGSPKFFELKGRVLEDQGIQPSRETDQIWDNLLNMYRRFESDEIPNARVLVRYLDQEIQVTADEEGFFDAAIELYEPFPPEVNWGKVELELLEPIPSRNEGFRTEGRVMIVSPEADFGVISDIDDTVVHTGVTRRIKLATTVLLKNAYTRLPLKGVAQFYNALQRGTDGVMKNPLFYVSSSPWNMYDLFQQFFIINDIPIGPVFLRDWGIERHSMVAEKNRLYKLNTISHLLEKFPQLRFILIGDSGEEDPEIYTEVLRSFPDRILSIYIRDVRSEPKRGDEIRQLAEQVSSSGSRLVLAKDANVMAAHAARQGWINSTARL